VHGENLARNDVYRRLFSPALACFAFLNFKKRAFQVRSGIEHGFRLFLNLFYIR
jgi:hypothetical protein